jgi:hypothetical protein
MKLFEAALRDAADCLFRHLLTCLTVASGISRDIVFSTRLHCSRSSRPFPLSSSVSAESAVPCGERRCISIIHTLT